MIVQYTPPRWALMLMVVLLHGSIAILANAETLTFPTAYDERSPHTINIRVLANDLNYATFGQLQLEVHPAGQLFPANAIYDAVQSGEADMGEVLLASLAERDPLFLIDNLPFLVADFDSAEALWEASRDHIEARLSEDGLTLLYATPWPPQGLYSIPRIDDIGDLKGLRIRSYSDTLEDLIALAGATPVSVDYTELRSAFHQGRIDAMITSATTGVRASAWEFASTYTDIKAWIPKNIVFINTDRLNNLNPEHRTLLMQQARVAEQRGWTIAREDYFRSRITLSDNGMAVRSPSPRLQKQLVSLGNTMTQEWLAQTGEDGERILTTYQNRVTQHTD